MLLKTTRRAIVKSLEKIRGKDGGNELGEYDRRVETHK
jgi:hypothetical protein